MTISVTEMISILVAIGGLVSVWIATSVRIARIETTMNLKFAAFEIQISGYINSSTRQVEQFIENNKDEHKELLHDVKNIRTSILAIAMNRPIPDEAL